MPVYSMLCMQETSYFKEKSWHEIHSGGMVLVNTNLGIAFP